MSRVTLNLMVALHSEAKPLIDYYRLQRSSSNGFACYVGETSFCDLSLVITGIGQLAMAAATAWRAGRQNEHPAAWLNLGTAGHADAPIGEVFRVAHCTNLDEQSAHLPPLVCRWQGAVASLQTENGAVTDYPPVAMVDMEGYAFFQTACRFAPAELVQSLKVVSDNRGTNLDTLSGDFFTQLVAAQTVRIVEFINGLVDLAGKMPKPDCVMQGFEQSIVKRRLTVSQRREINALAQDLINLGGAEELNSIAAQHERPKALISALRTQVRARAPTLS